MRFRVVFLSQISKASCRRALRPSWFEVSCWVERYTSTLARCPPHLYLPCRRVTIYTHTWRGGNLKLQNFYFFFCLCICGYFIPVVSFSTLGNSFKKPLLLVFYVLWGVWWWWLCPESCSVHAPAKAAGLICPLHDVLDLTVADTLAYDQTKIYHVLFPFTPFCPLYLATPDVIRSHALPQMWLCASRSAALPFIPPVKYNNLKDPSMELVYHHCRQVSSYHRLWFLLIL